MGFVITIDGPAASGKSSVSRELARSLNIPWVSTGAFYRGLAYAAIRKDIALTDRERLSELAMSNDWKVEMTPEKTKVWFESEDVTDKIGQENVGNAASTISHYPEIRQSLLDHQRSCALGVKGLVAEGRDCGTVVFPQAEVKVYITASSEHRASRRAQELGTDQKEMAQLQQVRDKQDSTRKVAPLQVPEGALVLDTTEMTFSEVFDRVLEFVDGKLKN
ncbi:MAG: cytidylate kinase [Bdellovibrionales bacterium RIFCSPHIGHO2_01_FULL_40_29]|nr:MAG: cytidylate kinase [Bdellovibrionales bacterium RIFCSPHIGHO2_01_FULL_40_29]OFZ33387.1 MAG: cytidylate kinase [Bdellovibrionales bacterium RIFCSPHIGHO2_02_FULL_40_15]